MSSSPFDLFRQPSKKPRSTSQPSAVTPTPSPSPNPQAASSQAKEDKSESFSAGANEIKDLYDKIAKMHDELEKQLSETFQQSGWSLQEIKQFLENPNNFDKFEWSRVQQEREHWNEQIWNVVGEEGKERTLKLAKKKLAEGKKGKLLGNRKNWIPVR